jgi:hypothetical protein
LKRRLARVFPTTKKKDGTAVWTKLFKINDGTAAIQTPTRRKQKVRDDYYGEQPYDDAVVVFLF